MRRNEPAVERSIDLDSVRPVAFEGGTTILARTYRQIGGTEIETGEIPVAVEGVYSPTDLRRSLRAAGFDHEPLERALSIEFRGENATRAVACAEKQAGQAVILA